MYRIDNNTATTSLPTPGAVGSKPNGFFTKGDPLLGVEATIVDDDFLNALQEEICHVIEQASITLDKTVRTQLYDAIVAIAVGLPYAASSSSPNTYTATLSPVIVGYTTGKVYAIKFTNGNTGAATLNLNAVGAKNIKRLDGSALNSGDIYDGMIGLLAYDGTNLQLLNANQQIVPYAASTTGANTYTATLSPPINAYRTGMTFVIKFTNANTDAATLNLNGLGTKSMVRPDGNPLIAGDIVDGMCGEFVYDGTHLQLLNPFAFRNDLLQPNIIIGGHFGTNPWQRGTSFPSTANGAFTADRFQWVQSGAGVVTVSKNTSTLPGSLLAGACFSTAGLKMVVTTADASLAATDWYSFRYAIEGFDFTQIAQKVFTISFLVYATTTGTYTVGISNSNGDRSYPATFTVTNSNTYQKVTITVPASPSAGTWDYTNGIGLNLMFVQAAGSNFTGTPNTWNSGASTNKIAATGQVNNMATNGNIFIIEQLSVNGGAVATPYAIPNITEVEMRCKRYCEKSYPKGVNPGTNTLLGYFDFSNQISLGNGTSIAVVSTSYKVEKRATPTLSVYSLAGTVDKFTQDDGTEVAFSGVSGTLQNSTNGYVLQGTNTVGRYALRHHYFADAEL